MSTLGRGLRLWRWRLYYGNKERNQWYHHSQHSSRSFIVVGDRHLGISTRARNTPVRAQNFHGRFYGWPIFSCKTAHLGVTLRELAQVRLALKNTLCNAMKTCEKTR